MNKARNRDFTPQNVKRLIKRGRKLLMFETITLGNGCVVTYVPWLDVWATNRSRKIMNDDENNDCC